MSTKDKDCKCPNISLWDDGTRRCILCAQIYHEEWTPRYFVEEGATIDLLAILKGCTDVPNKDKLVGTGLIFVAASEVPAAVWKDEMGVTHYPLGTRRTDNI